MKTRSSQKKQSLAYIAETLQVSPATVSRVLNNNPHVKEHTRAKVMALVEELGFRKNMMASRLRSNKTHTVGLIVPRISMYVHAEIITTIQNELHRFGYSLLLSQSNDSIDMEKELVRTLYASRVDAVIVACTLYTSDFSHFDILKHSHIPIIFYDRVPKESPGAVIIKGDDFRGGYLAGKHLIDLGCKRIAHITGPTICNLYTDRLAGFNKALELSSIELNEAYVFYQELNADNARRAMHTLFSTEPYPDAVFAANDVTALTVLAFAKERGISVPGELKIVGYSNDPRSAIISPSITTIDQFPATIGKVISEETIKILKSAEPNLLEIKPIITPVELIRRMST
jgi:LacI family transcriptional regulator